MGWEIVWQEAVGAASQPPGGPGATSYQSATEIPAMEAMAMTSLKPKLPKVLPAHLYGSQMEVKQQMVVGLRRS